MLKADLVEVYERDWMDDIEGEKHVQFLGDKLRKVKEFLAKHKVEVRKMETKMNKALEEQRIDLFRFLPEKIPDVITQDLMGGVDKLREKEDRLGEVLTLRIQYKKEVTVAIEKIRDIQKRTDMGLVEVLDTLKKIISALRSIEEGWRRASEVILEEDAMFKLCIYWVCL